MMHPLQSPAAGLVAGATAVGILAVAHFLRARPRRLVVPTTIFWQTAAPFRQSRVFWGRFHGWRTLLLLAAIACLLAVAASGIRRNGNSGRAADATVIILDAATTGARQEAIEAIRADVARSPGMRLALIENAAIPRLLCDFDDPMAVALRSLTPAGDGHGRSPSPAQALRLAATLVPNAESRVALYTDRDPPIGAIPQTMGSRITIHRLQPATLLPDVIGATYHVRTDPDARDGVLSVTIRAPQGKLALPRVVAETPGRSLTAEAVAAENGLATASFNDVLADGSVWVVHLENGGVPLRFSSLTLHVPRRTRPSFRLSGTLPTRLLKALRAIGDVDSSAASLNVSVITDADARPPAGSIAILDDSSQLSTDRPSRVARISLESTDPLATGLVLEEAACVGPTLTSLPSDRPLITADGGGVLALLRPAAASGQAADHFSAIFSSGLFAETSNASDSPALIVLLERAVRAVLNEGSVEVIALPFERVVDDPTWSELSLSKVGSTSLLADPRQEPTENLGADDGSALRRSSPARALEWWQIALWVAFAGMFAEAVLYARRRIV